MTTIVKVKFGVPGFHAWPEAPTRRDYLRARHRHMFNFLVEVKVGHGDREVEFHDLKEEVRRCFPEGWTSGPAGVEFGSDSCETIAMKIMHLLTVSWKIDYGHDIHVAAVEVWEDGECGARVEV